MQDRAIVYLGRHASATLLSKVVATPLRFLSASLYLVKETLIEIGCVVTLLVVGRWLVVTRMHCGQTVHPRPIVTMEH